MSKLYLWGRGEDLSDAWTPCALRATILIDSDSDHDETSALVTLIDNGCYGRTTGEPADSTPRYYQVPNDLIPEFIAAAMRAWSTHDANPNSVAVLWRRRPKPPVSNGHASMAAKLPALVPNGDDGLKGTLWPPPKTPAPAPFGNPSLFMMVNTAHLQLLAVSEHTAESVRAELASGDGPTPGTALEHQPAGGALEDRADAPRNPTS